MNKNIWIDLVHRNWRPGKTLLRALVGVVFLAGIGLGATPAFAQDNCIQDQWKADGNKQKLTCTANDVRIAEASRIRDLSGKPLDSCIEGSTFSFIADFKVVLGAQERYDIGLYFATDGDENGTGDGAITGACSVNIIEPLSGNPALGSANFIQLDASPDTCGDINADNNPQIVTVQVINVLCQDPDGDSYLNLPNCTSWRQDGANEICTKATDAFPGSPSKCNCDPDYSLPITVESGNINATKTVSPSSLPEPGGTFTFTVDIMNEAQYTDLEIIRICDSDHGTIAYYSGDACPTGTLGGISGTNCTLPQTLVPGQQYSCTFDAEILSDVPVLNEQDTVTVVGLDAKGDEVSASDTASIAITDVPPSAMVTKAFDGINCVNATYSVLVENKSTVDDLELKELIDTPFGDVTTIQGNVTRTTCSGLPFVIPIGESYTCEFDADFCGVSHTNEVEATLMDNDGNTIKPSSDSVVVTVSGIQE